MGWGFPSPTRICLTWARVPAFSRGEARYCVLVDAECAPTGDGTWWDAAEQQYADSLTSDNQQSFQKHWIGQTPMEAELHVNGQTVAGLAPQGHGAAALAGRENDCFSGTHPLSPGLFHTGCGGGADGKGEKVVFGLTTSIQSVGEGNYGRLFPKKILAQIRKNRLKSDEGS